jgi:hypothetical protein
VFETPRHQREKCVSLINQLTQAADTVIFIQHTEAGGWKREAKGLRCCLNSISLLALYVTKTACDAFYNTGLEALLREQGIRSLSSAAAPPITASMRRSKTASAGVITSPLRKMPIPPPTARRLTRRS